MQLEAMLISTLLTYCRKKIEKECSFQFRIFDKQVIAHSLHFKDTCSQVLSIEKDGNSFRVLFFFFFQVISCASYKIYYEYYVCMENFSHRCVKA